MIIYLSPAKTIKGTLNNSSDNDLFKPHRLKLLNKLKACTPTQLKTLYKASDKIVEQQYQNFQSHQNIGRAIDVFSGASYQALDYPTMKNKQALENSLLIGDGYYGLLKANTQVHHYRLDYTNNTKEVLELNLFEYWQPKIEEYLLSLESQVLIDLSSQEFSRLLDTKSIHNHFEIKRPQFLIDGKSPSFHVKKARGLMTRFIIENPNTPLEDFNLDGFVHDHDLIFTKSNH